MIQINISGVSMQHHWSRYGAPNRFVISQNMDNPQIKIKDAAIYILVSDDSVRRSLELLCTTLDADLHTYVSVTELLAGEPPSPPGCLVADMELPGMNGFKLMDKLRDMDVMVPVILLAINSDVETAVRAMRAGAYDFVEKPFLSRNFLERVQNAIQTSVGW